MLPAATSRTLRLTAVLAVLCVLATAGCGSSSSPRARTSTTTRPTTTTAPATTTAPPTTAATTSEATTTAPGTAPCASPTEGLTTRQKVAQLLMAELTFDQVGQGVGLVRDDQVGGIVFLGTPGDDLADGLAAIRKAAPGDIQPLLATDEEGGRVQRLTSLLGKLPSARQQAATMTPDQVTAMATDHARAMKQLGIDVDLAPVVDINETPTDTGVIGDRSFSTDPATASAYGLAFERGLDQAGVLGTVKHFPGHGRASGDSHEGAVTTPPLSDLRQADLIPFVDAVHADVPAIMVGHLTVPGLTDGMPASLSPAAIKGLLRGELGYDGLVITDSLEMGAVTQADGDPYDVVERTIVAGADVAMLPGDIDVGKLLDRLTADAGTDKLPTADIDRALRHVRTAKTRIGDWPEGAC
jgi:beta-N-acetylhexosaminidase